MRCLVNSEEGEHPVGAIVTVADDFAINNQWLECDGRELHVEQYPELFNILSDTYGGDLEGDIQTFNLPDLRGLFGKDEPVEGLFVEDEELESYMDRIGVDDE